MGTAMKRNSDIDKERFDDAMTDAFRNAPSCGDFGEIDTLRRRRMMNRILSASPPPKVHGLDDFQARSRDRINRWFWVAAAVFVAAVAVGIVVNVMLTPAPTAPPVTPTVNVTEGQRWFGEVVRAGESVIVDARSTSNHARIPVDRAIFTNGDNALLRLPTGIDWWMSAHSEGRVAAVAETQIEVAVNNGESWFQVDPKRKDAPAFIVQTPLGRIHITGTIFVVDVTPSEVSVTLLKGQVWIVRHSGQKSLLKSGRMMHLGNGHQTELAVSEIERYHKHLITLAWDNDIRLPNSPTDNKALETDSSVQGAGKNKKALMTPASENRTIPMTVQQMHREIQSARTRGNWERVASLYRKIIKTSPGSEAAIVSRVSLGEVYLTKLHRYNDALKQFNRYIQSNHQALLQEALYGKCTTLKAQKNGLGEQKCLERFVQRFPSTFQSADARVRLKALNKDSGK